MVNVNVLYNTTTGRILSANLNAIAPIPAGHAITVKDVASMGNLFDKRIRPNDLALVDKDYLRLDSPFEVPKATVQTVVWTKRDGETEAAKTALSDNEVVLVSAREPDLSFNAILRRAFFEVPQTQMVQGAGQVKVATGLAPGQETIVVFHDTLKPIFKTFNYV